MEPGPSARRIIAESECNEAFTNQLAEEAQIAAEAAERVAAVMGELRRPSGDKRIAALRQARLARIKEAFPEDGELEAIFATYGTAVRRGDRAIDLADAVATADKLRQTVRDLMQTLGDMAFSLRGGDVNREGRAIGDHADFASAHLAIASREMAAAIFELEAAASLAPVDAKGRGGRMGRLREAPRDVLADSLALLWVERGLRLAGGERGDGLDVVLHGVFGEKTADALAKLRKARAIASPKLTAE